MPRSADQTAVRADIYGAVQSFVLNEACVLVMASVERELCSGGRFRFGDNWKRYIASLNETRIQEAEASLIQLLGLKKLSGLSFLDVGSGSGLFSLAARRLGAKVRSFDYDPGSVACTKMLRDRHFEGDPDWTVEQGSIIDADYVAALGKFDVVYGWGVLHHTGAMWKSLENIVQPVGSGGMLAIALYNDQGWISHYWRWVKRTYNTSRAGQVVMVLIHAPYLVGGRFLVRAATGRLNLERGMSIWHDFIDWLGGYPFEVAIPAEVEHFFVARGFSLVRATACGRRHGCNEFVFTRGPAR